MKTKYRIIITALICLHTIVGRAQTVKFDYDNDGNVRQRKVLIMSVPKQKQATETPAPVTQDLGEQKISLYPNPTRGEFLLSVQLLNNKETNSYSLYSLNGSLIAKEPISGNSTTVNISEYPKGIYLLDIFLGDKVSRWKVIKQ